MKIERIGYGAGHKDFTEQPNILRLIVGETGDAGGTDADQVCVLETNLDDISGEVVAYCVSRLWDAGALDVYTTAIGMKKGRPAVKLSVSCRPEEAAAMEDILFREANTLGVRRWTAWRRVLRRGSRTRLRRLGDRWKERSLGCPTARRVSRPSSSPADALPRPISCRSGKCSRRRRRRSIQGTWGRGTGDGRSRRRALSTEY